MRTIYKHLRIELVYLSGLSDVSDIGCLFCFAGETTFIEVSH